jgi:hypothetical protein
MGRMEALQAAPSARFHVNVGQPLPNVELSAGIPAPDGELTLYADFERAGENGVPVFIVNRTAKPVELHSQDHDPYLKLEYLDGKKGWKRAQVNISSGCGNSYYQVTLPPGQHFRFSGYRAEKGETTTVRYRSTSNLVSNLGQGLVNAADIQASEHDHLAVYSVPAGLGEILCHTQPYRQGEPVTAGKYATALGLMAGYHDSSYYRREARRFLDAVAPDHEDAERINSILASQWPAERDPLGLFNLALTDADGLKEFPELRWSVVRDLLVDPDGGRTGPEWRTSIQKACAMLPAALTSSNDAEVQAAAAILAIPIATEEFVTTADLRGWLEHGKSAVMMAAANALSRRREWRWLAIQGKDMGQDARLTILAAMASGGLSDPMRPRDPDSFEEKSFWSHCAIDYPKETVEALDLIGHGVVPGNRFSKTLYAPLRNFLETEAGLMTADPAAVTNEEHGYPVAKVVAFVGGWKQTKDASIFRRLLKHPGFQRGTVIDSEGRRFEQRRFRVREEAMIALKAMGVIVEDDVVLNERIPLPPE